MHLALTFSYDFGQVYLYDSKRTWPDDGSNVYLDAFEDANARGLSVGVADELVDLLMVRQDNFEAALALEVHEQEPDIDLTGWDHVVEFALDLPSGSLTFEASGGSGEAAVEVPAGAYQARWSGRQLDEAAGWSYDEADDDENPPDEYRLQLWPAGSDVQVCELKRSSLYDIWRVPPPR